MKARLLKAIGVLGILMLLALPSAVAGMPDANDRIVVEQQTVAPTLYVSQDVALRSFWLFAKARVVDGQAEPALPENSGRSTVPGDVITLTGGPEGQEHVHLLVGGIALPADDFGGQYGDHRHYVIKNGGSYIQVTVGAPSHTHDLNTGIGGNLIPAYFMLFWAGSQADAVTIAADGNCFPVVEADVTQGEDGSWSIGALQGGWATQDTEYWQAQVLALLGVQMPEEVDRGSRLVRLFLGAFLSRQTGEEQGYHFSGID